jgi:PAS domain S-box-containing protein
MMNYSFSDLVDLDDLQSLCEQFTQLTGFVTAILDMKGAVLIATGWQEACTGFHRVNPATAARCRESDTILANRLLQGEEYTLYRCGNGLIDVAVPIIIDGAQVGNLYSGQFLLEPPDMELFRRQAEEFGFDETSYLDAVSRVPVVTEERVRLVMGFLCRLAQMIGRMGLANRRIDDANLIINDSPAVLFRWRTSEGWPIEFVSESVNQFGYTPEELIAGEVPYSSMIHPDDLERLVSEVDDYTSRGVDRLQLEYRIVTKGGDVRWVEERTVTERDAEGRRVLYRGIVLDITERRLAEEALRFTQFAMDNSSSQAFWTTEIGRILYVNDAACRALGYTREELLTMSVRDIAPEMTDEVFAFHWRELQERGEITLETVNRGKDGRVYPVEVRANILVFDGREYNCVFVMDISERRRVEDALRFTQFAVDNTFTQAFWTTADGGIFYVNDAACRTLGYTRDELVGMTISDIAPTFPPGMFAEHWRELQQKGSVTFESWHRAKDGSVYPVEVNANHVVFDGREYNVGFATDIRKRKQAEEALKKSEERMRLFFEHQLVGMAITSPEKGWVQVNDKLCEMLGYTRDELSSLTWAELTHPDDLAADVERFERLIAGEIDGYSLEKRFIRKDGVMVFTNLSVGCVRSAEGSMDYVLALLEDITERKRAEEALRVSEQRYRDIFESAPIGIYRSTLEGKFLAANPALARILKYDSPEGLLQAVNKKSVGEVHYLEPERRVKIVDMSLPSHEWNIYEEKFRCTDGSVVTTNFYHRSVPDTGGNSIEFEGFVEDITERKRAEEALRLTQYCVDNASIGLCLISSGMIMQANEQMCRQLGYSLEELTSLGIQDIDAFLTPEQVIQRIRQTEADGRSNFETLHRRKDGSVFPVDVSSTPLHFAGRDIIVSFCQDITERKRAEEALRESEEKFRLLTETSPNAILLCRGERVLYANPAAAQLSGYTVEEMTSMNFWDFIHEDNREMVRERGLARQRGEPVPSRYECRIVTKSGADRWVLVSGAPMGYEGMPTSIITILDITEAKRAEGALRHSEERLRLALAAANQAFYDIDVRSGTAQVSSEFALMMGYEPEEYTTTLDNLQEHMHPDDRDLAFEAYESAVEGVSPDFATEYRHRTKTGNWKWVLSLGKVMEHDAEGKALRVMGTVTDISERKNTEERIRASLAEKTVLLKEVHHRVKNNLQIICALLDLQSDSIADAQSRTCFQESQDRIRSMALVHEQLYRSRDFASIDFADYIDNLAMYLFNSYVKNTERIIMRVEADSVSLGIDLSIPCGLIVNELVSNSLKHAFPDNRKGEIAIGLSADDEGLITLTVTDDGVGFPVDFDFMNTQSLGLQLVSMLVKQLQGGIELRNDDGASFVVRFRGAVEG